MKKDKEKTCVMFYFEKDSDEVLAVFTEEPFNVKLYGNEVLSCYAHIGQHSSCHKDYLSECAKCRSSLDYEYLKLELEDLGYNLQILN